MVDEFTRENLVLEVGRGFTAQVVVEQVAGVIARRGAPAHIRSDNGPEFVAQALRSWLEDRHVARLYIEPGAPWENAYVESFNGKLKDELIKGELFTSLLEAQVLTRDWREDYNHRRPHSALDYLTPAAFASRWGVGPSGLRPHSPPAKTKLDSHCNWTMIWGMVKLRLHKFLHATGCSFL